MPQNSTTYVGIECQTLESSNKEYFIGLKACNKKVFFPTKLFKEISNSIK
jgi:hypothetical protein